jgi:hypothetical protein
MEVLRLDADELLVAGEQSISDGIYDCGLTAIISADQRCYATFEYDCQRSFAIAKLTEVSDNKM